jgi:hypothetical protein
MADGKTVGLGYYEEMVCANQSPSAGHVVDDDGRVAGNILAEMAGDKASVSIVPTSRRGPNYDSDRFPLVERCGAMGELRTGADRKREKNENCRPVRQTHRRISKNSVGHFVDPFMMFNSCDNANVAAKS